MNRTLFSIPFWLGACLLLGAAPSHAELPPDVLAKNRWMELTRADFDTALKRVPPKMRFEFTTSPKRVQDMLNSLLVTKTLAAQARAHGTRATASLGPNATAAATSDAALANAELKRIEADANATFDAQKAAFEARAQEFYKLNPNDYRTPEAVRLSDISVLIKDRGDGAARQRAIEARARIVAGADFAAVAREYSDDASTRDKGGALPFVTAKDLAPDYAKAVFAMQGIGEISQPIKAPSAYHVVRLEERRPSRLRSFEEVHDAIMQGLRERHVAEQRDLRIRAIHADPQIQVNQPAIDALVTRVDPKLFGKKPEAARVLPAPK
jgi:hypothetical protein